MEQITNFKKAMPNIVKQVADWFEIDVTIKLFGVKVFSFTWPPTNQPVDEPQNV